MSERRLRGTAATAGLQTFGGMYGDAVQGYMNRGDSESTALNKAFIPALAGAASTYLLTAAGGTQGIEALLRQPAFKENFRQWFKAVAAGSVKEGLREEAPDQLIQGMIERYTYNPDKPWKEIIEETLQAGIGGALLSGAVEATTTGVAPAKTDQDQTQPPIPPNTTPVGRPSTPPLSVEQSQKLIQNVMNRPPEQRGHPTTQADLAQAQWVVREQVRKLESQKEPLNETQQKALTDAKAALARVVPEVKSPQPNGTTVQGDKKTTGPQLPFAPSPNLEWNVPHEPTRHLLPDKPFDATRKPTKPPKVLNKNDTNIHNKRGVDGENETAEVLAQNGYAYEQVAQNKTRLPDGTWAGTADGVFGKAPNSKSDVYSPAAQTSLRNIYDVVVGKVDRQKSPYVVVRLEPGGQSIEDIAKKFHENPVEGLKQLFVVKEGKLYIIY